MVGDKQQKHDILEGAETSSAVVAKNEITPRGVVKVRTLLIWQFVKGLGINLSTPPGISQKVKDYVQ